MSARATVPVLERQWAVLMRGRAGRQAGAAQNSDGERVAWVGRGRVKGFRGHPMDLSG